MHKRKYFEIHSNIILKQPLDPSHISRIVEAGITFFLYQRGQIPLPYERLQFLSKEQEDKDFVKSSTDSASVLLKEEKEKLPMEPHGDDIVAHKQNTRQDKEIPAHLLKGQRLKYVVQQKKLMQQQNRAIQNRREMFKKESHAKMTLGLALEKLRCVFTAYGEGGKLENMGIVSIILIFGPSIHSPKEIIRFELDQVAEYDSTIDSVNSFEKMNQQSASALIRNFYKCLIMSPDFLDFTSKTLMVTYTHICLQTKTELINKNGELIRLENNVSDSWSNAKANRKLLCVKLAHSCGSSLKEENGQNSTSANNDNYLFDKNSLCLYQIPLRFKGVKCKSKPVM